MIDIPSIVSPPFGSNRSREIGRQFYTQWKITVDVIYTVFVVTSKMKGEIEGCIQGCPLEGDAWMTRSMRVKTKRNLVGRSEGARQSIMEGSLEGSVVCLTRGCASSHRPSVHRGNYESSERHGRNPSFQLRTAAIASARGQRGNALFVILLFRRRVH